MKAIIIPFDIRTNPHAKIRYEYQFKLLQFNMNSIMVEKLTYLPKKAIINCPDASPTAPIIFATPTLRHFASPSDAEKKEVENVR